MTEQSRLRGAFQVLAPVIGLGVVVLLISYLNPIAGSFRPGVPVEEIAFERIVLGSDIIEMEVRNDGPDPITISQVLVNDAYWAHDITERDLARLETATISISYPWEPGTEIHVTLLTATGATATHVIEAAASTPQLTASVVRSYVFIGFAVGVAPVALGLLWLGMLKQMRQRVIDLALAFTVGLLLFLLVESVNEGLEAAEEAAETLNGLGLFTAGALLSVWAILAVSDERKQEQPEAPVATGTRSTGLHLAYLLAVGIGLHNFGEGLAIGSALAGGSVALGVSLIVGFMVHNLTEGFAIATPLGNTALPSPQHFLWLVLIAGALTIPGALLGGSLISPMWTALFFGIASGAIAQVVWVVAAGLLRRRTGLALTTGGLLAGYAVMYVTGLLTV